MSADEICKGIITVLIYFRFYDVDGAFLRTYPMVNVSQRQGFLVADDNMEKILRGSYRQPSGKFDHTIDYDVNTNLD